MEFLLPNFYGGIGKNGYLVHFPAKIIFVLTKESLQKKNSCRYLIVKLLVEDSIMLVFWLTYLFIFIKTFCYTLNFLLKM